KSFAKGEYPYAETLESIYYKQLSGGVDINVVFPFTSELFCDLRRLIDTGDFVEDGTPLSPVPYELENRYLLRETYEYSLTPTDRFLPFLCIDPGRYQKEQLLVIKELVKRYPVYGIKIVPVVCQSRTLDLMGFPEFFDFAEENNLPILFHSTSDPAEKYSYAGDLFKLIDAYPNIRYCLAHCIIFHNGFLREADSRKNVWVDNSAMKIQVDALLRYSDVLKLVDRFPADYSDYRKVFKALVDSFPNTMIWGTDSPAYAYMVDRMDSGGSITQFRLKGTYKDEINGLNYLSAEQKKQVANINPLEFLFGDRQGAVKI
ncbi:MAG: amidohydrolase family protein, partial [Lentisphaerota bacterium]